MKFLSTLEAKYLAEKVILLRCDLNVPMIDGEISDDTRIQHMLPTLKYLRKFNCKIHLLSHFGRPKGQRNEALSLKFLAPILSSYMNEKIVFEGNNFNEANIILHENLRFSPGEENNDLAFAKQLATKGEIYINDAFSACHRTHASVVAITQFLPSYAGFGLEKEIKALEIIFNTQKKPMLAIIGGAKVSTKITLLKNLIPKIDHLILGGAMANTFLKATNNEVGKSLIEAKHLPTALKILALSKQHGCKIHLPIDVICNKNLESNDAPEVFNSNNMPANLMIFDSGPKTISAYRALISTCKTLLWNGPLGVFEKPPYDFGTTAIAQYVADLTMQNKLVSVAGGGDTYAALNHAKAAQNFSYVSCAGGAFLEWLEGKMLPGILALNQAH